MVASSKQQPLVVRNDGDCPLSGKAEDRLAARGESRYRELAEQRESSCAGMVVAIEVDSGDYYVGDDLVDADQRASRDYPDGYFYFRDIGVWRGPSSLTFGTSDE